MYCQCGCGNLAPISSQTHRKYGWVKGKAKKFILGHGRKLQIGEKEPRWKGGKVIQKGHYNIRVKNHPTGRVYIPLATIKAEGVLGRTLKKGEMVHHINGNPLDDRNENLLICTRSFHQYLHGKSRGGLNHAKIYDN